LFFGLEFAVLFSSKVLEVRVKNERHALDLWKKLDEDEFRDVAGVSCSLDRFADELFRLLEAREQRDRT
jgi:hypothetical protein